MTLQKCTVANSWKPNIDILPGSNVPRPSNVYLDPDGAMEDGDVGPGEASTERKVPIDYPEEFEKTCHDKNPGRNVYAQTRKLEFFVDMPPHRISTEHRTSLVSSQE